MFTGIVEERGARPARSDCPPARGGVRGGARRQRDRGVGGRERRLPDGRGERRRDARLRPVGGDDRPHEPPTPRPGDPVNLERPVTPRGAPGRAPGAGPRRRRRRDRRASSPTRPAGPGSRSGCRRRCAATLVEKGSVTVDGVSLTVAALHGRRDHRSPLIPHTLAVTTLGAATSRRPGEPRGGRDRASTWKRLMDGVRTMSEQLHDDVDRSVFASIPEALEDIRDGKIILVVDDADRENEGDFIVAAEMATPEAVELHGHARAGDRVPAGGGVAPRRARDPADGDRDHRRARGGVHGLDRLPARHDHRHERARPRRDGARDHRSRREARTTSRSRATSSR